jgi:hypothetical protein
MASIAHRFMLSALLIWLFLLLRRQPLRLPLRGDDKYVSFRTSTK